MEQRGNLKKKKENQKKKKENQKKKKENQQKKKNSKKRRGERHFGIYFFTMIKNWRIKRMNWLILKINSNARNGEPME